LQKRQPQNGRLAQKEAESPMNVSVRARDFFDRMQRENQSFRLLSSSIVGDDVLLRGKFSRMTVRKGLTVHYSDVTNLCDLNTEMEMPPHLGIKLFFHGGVAASIGGCNIPMPQEQERSGRWIPSATILNQRDRELFRRRAVVGDRIRKFTIRIFPEWLESGATLVGGGSAALNAFLAQRLSFRTWSPSQTLVALAEQAMNPPRFEPFLTCLYLESRVLGIIAEAFAQFTNGGTGRLSGEGLSAFERRRLQRADEFLRACRGASPTVEELAAAAGVSVNTLQRLFHAAYDTTVFNFIRTTKLNQARIGLESGGLTIAQAAHIAGYTSTANFSTAFKRQYGLSPRQLRS
jgi:AraC-like DNA-binding protein